MIDSLTCVRDLNAAYSSTNHALYQCNPLRSGGPALEYSLGLAFMLRAAALNGKGQPSAEFLEDGRLHASSFGSGGRTMQRREELILTRFVAHEGERIAVLVDARLHVGAADGSGSVFARLQPAAIVQIGARGARMYGGADAGRLCRRLLAQLDPAEAEPKD